MQGGFIGGIKDTLKTLKQEIKGAEVFGVEVKLPENNVIDREFVLTSNIHSKEFTVNTSIYEKQLGIKTEIYTIDKSDIIPTVKSFEFGMNTEVKNYNFENISTKVKGKDLEGFFTFTKTKEIELTKKTRINNSNIDKFKIKTFEGTEKIRKIPVTLEGRRFLSNKELIELAIKIKTNNKSLDFTKYNFKVVFENLLFDYIDDFQYIDDTAQLKVYYKKYSANESVRKKLVILTEKNSLKSEKIFV